MPGAGPGGSWFMKGYHGPLCVGTLQREKYFFHPRPAASRLGYSARSKRPGRRPVIALHEPPVTRGSCWHVPARPAGGSRRAIEGAKGERPRDMAALVGLLWAAVPAWRATSVRVSPAGSCRVAQEGATQKKQVPAPERPVW